MTFHFTVVLTGGSSAGSCNHIGTIQPDTLVSLGLVRYLTSIIIFYKSNPISENDDFESR